MIHRNPSIDEKPMKTENMTIRTIQEVAARFNQLAQQEKWFEIQDELFSDNVRSIEPPTAVHLKDAAGKAAVRSSYTSAPVIGGNHFSVGRGLDTTVSGLGRFKMDEVMVYEVKNGQIVLEQFFY
jgi:hypothetical protein